jgi:hypothetical protein
MVAEGGGLGLLEVGVAGYRNRRLGFGEIGEGAGETAKLVAAPPGGPSEIQAEIEGHLIIAGAPGVELFTRLPDKFDETALDGRVDILVGFEEVEGPGASLAENA